MEGYHSSVLLREALTALNVRDAWYLDCTLGDGGYSIEIIQRGGQVLGIDVDPQALKRVHERFGSLGILGDKYKLIQGNFRDLKNLIQQMDMLGSKIAGAVFDLGVSSLQIEDSKRGFSFGKQGPLDMRMEPTLQVKALDLVNGLNKGELDELFKKLGEETHSRRLAEAVVCARQINRIETTTQLAELVEETLGRGLGKIHPATKVFQALRIAVNDELNALKSGLSQALDVLEKGGRLVVVSFHSLEDRIVKRMFLNWQAQGLGEVLTKKPVTPSMDEVASNPRSRSAKMRVFKKL